MNLLKILLVTFGTFVGLLLIFILFGKRQEILKTGLKLWLSADVGVVTSKSGKVSQWKDRSRSENQIKASMTKELRQPSLVYNALNELPVIRFEGKQSLSLSPFLSPTEFTIAVVGKNSNPRESFSMILGPGGKSPNNQLRWENSSKALFVGTSNNFPTIISNIGDTRTYHLLSARYDGTTMTVYRDGIAISSHQFQTTGAWTLGQIGAWYSKHFLIGDLAEIIVYDLVLTDEDLQLVNTYLKNKYNLD